MSITLFLFPCLLLFLCPTQASVLTSLPGLQRSPHTWIPFLSRQTAPREANIAYFVQISDSTLTLFPRLLRSLWHERNTYVIHFDKKIPQWQRAHAETYLYKGNDHYKENVHVMESEMITYRGISMVINLLNAMQEALDHSDDWHYFINVSGSDYPLISPDNQRKLLASNDFLSRNRTFFSFSNPGWWAESKVFRFDRLFTDTSVSFNDSESQIIDSYSDQPIAHVSNFTFVAAEAWMILHRAFVKHLLKSSFARRLLVAFAYSLEPEEHYFPAVAYNSPQFNATAVPHSLRFVAWVHKGKHSGQHPYYVDELEDDGKTWTFGKVIQASGCFFARKIRTQDSGFLEYIDNHVNGLGKKVVQSDVTSYMRRATETVDCLAKLSSGASSSRCFPDVKE